MYILMKPRGYAGKNVRNVDTFKEMVELAGKCGAIDVEYRLEPMQPLETEKQGEAFCEYLLDSAGGGETLKTSPAVWRYRFSWG